MQAALRQWNPVFWLMWLIPAAAVVAGIGLVVVAMKDADRALPAMYHWEGERLDADFERARQAATLGIHAALEWRPGQCSLRLTGATAPRALLIHFTHADDAALDRTLTLLRHTDGDFRGACDRLPAGRWRVALTDDAGTWSVRAQVEGAAVHLAMRARDPAGPGT
jgi:hypothetical protein